MQFFNVMMAYAIPLVPRFLVQRISRRYIAGADLTQAVARIRQLNAQGFPVTVDDLGELVITPGHADAMVDEYEQVLQAIDREQLQATISVKPSAVGLLLDAKACGERLEQLLASAAAHATSICLDMEDASCTQAEIDLFGSLAQCHRNVHLAVQAYLRRTHRDMEFLLGLRATMRICKGIYVEQPDHLVDGALSNRTAINPHFLAHVSRCFEAGTFVAVATHDAALIQEVVHLARRTKISATAFEFQMLLGVCEPLRDQLRTMGFTVRIYVPYGKDWYGYSTRRIKENPQIVGHLARALMGY
ncbi:proline dehydrogenase [Acidovorax sp. CF316]|uniref:proline dehydrogenase family protein n=1 Tax=Acidovorax sp. CF316 TaxID=1144317 RepID=UPI00026BDE33|nr:proline dehydrogenase family protein [Acidovorax sp. CF316]EJE54988.1 proline dehydrogenase [Acidovorax sp. CF316]